MAKKGNLYYIDDTIDFTRLYEKTTSFDSMNCIIYRKYINLPLLGGDVETAKIQYNQLLLVNPLFEDS